MNADSDYKRREVEDQIYPGERNCARDIRKVIILGRDLRQHSHSIEENVDDFDRLELVQLRLYIIFSVIVNVHIDEERIEPEYGCEEAHEIDFAENPLDGPHI